MTTDTIEPTSTDPSADPPSATPSPALSPAHRTTDPTGLFRLLADGLRLRILDAVTPGTRNVGELCRELGVSQPSISHGLSLLSVGGLVTKDREGKANYYRLTAKGRRVLAFVEREAGAGAAADEGTD